MCKQVQKIRTSQDFTLTNSCTELSFSLWVYRNSETRKPTLIPSLLRYQASFCLWRTGPIPKQCKVPKYNDHDWRFFEGIKNTSKIFLQHLECNLFIDFDVYHNKCYNLQWTCFRVTGKLYDVRQGRAFKEKKKTYRNFLIYSCFNNPGNFLLFWGLCGKFWSVCLVGGQDSARHYVSHKPDQLRMGDANSPRQ